MKDSAPPEYARTRDVLLHPEWDEQSRGVRRTRFA